jgi:transcription elongation factor Elf1
MKKCTQCNAELSFDNFPFDKQRNRYLSVCKQCRDTIHPQRRKNLINEWKSKGCIKCGDTRIYVIDAHHINPNHKDFVVGTQFRGIKVIKKELEKCVPLCSNCHREFHHMEQQNSITLEEYLK